MLNAAVMTVRDVAVFTDMRNFKINTTMKEEACTQPGTIMTTKLIKASKLNLILQATAPSSSAPAESHSDTPCRL
ncbi:unnamed protein product [Arctia plantaginis]|uniref:Uncharacterized protein n=1 Tax=Arctia plantaginis TaxID=874455 RepID=A0A8S0Z8X6_ARCPL|nr:unnamed protein product [Arctia plantaginis]CAB3235735.1 unnamed protein product [Arctia plantaginis]